MDKEIELFCKLLEKNFSNQVIDEFVIIKIEKEYPSDLPHSDIIIDDDCSLLESCFTIWDISSRLIIQNKKSLVSNNKYILRLRLLCCRFLYFIFSKYNNRIASCQKKSHNQLKAATQHTSQEQKHITQELPILFEDSEIVLETLKMFIRCAQNCFEVDDNLKLNECLAFLMNIEQDFEISNISLVQNSANISIYLLTHRWILQFYVKENHHIPDYLIKTKFPALLQTLAKYGNLEEKEQIVTLMLMIICRLMSCEKKDVETELIHKAFGLFEGYESLLKVVRPEILETYQKMIVYTSIQENTLDKNQIFQLYEQLSLYSGDKLTEYLKLLVEAKLKLNDNANREISKDDMEFLLQKVEYLITQQDIDSEEFVAFTDELCGLYGNLGARYLSCFLTGFLDISTQGHHSTKVKAKKVDAVALKLVEHWISQLEEQNEISEVEASSLKEQLQVLIKSVIKDKISAKKLPTLEKKMVHLARLLVLKQCYNTCYELLANLMVLIRKDHVLLLKEVCILQIENCFYLKKGDIKDVFEVYDTVEADKQEFVYNVCQLKVLVSLSGGENAQAKRLAQEIPRCLDSVVESKNFDAKVFFLIVMEFLQESVGIGGRRGSQNPIVVLKEFFIILRKGLEKVIDFHIQGVEEKNTEKEHKNSFALFRLFCIYLSSFEGVFEKAKSLDLSSGAKNVASEIIGHDTIKSVLEVGFLILETFRIFSEKYVAACSGDQTGLSYQWLAEHEELNYIDKFYWDIAILAGYLNLELNFAQRFIFLSLKIKLMRQILLNLAKFREFLTHQLNSKMEIDIDTELFLQYLIYDAKELLWEDDGLSSLIKILLLYVSNTLCIIKNREHSNGLSDELLILRCLELDRALIISSSLDNKLKSYLQYHCLIEFEYRLLIFPETVRGFLEEFCIHAEVEAQLFLVFAEIAKRLNRREEYLLCLKGHAKAAIKDRSMPSLSMECYVELLENCQTIEEEISYLRQLFTFLEANVENLKDKKSLDETTQEVEYLCLFCRTKLGGQSKLKYHRGNKKELYTVKNLLLEEIEARVANLRR